MTNIGRPGDFWSGLALVALGAYIVAEARGWTYMDADGPGAGFFPLWYGIAMVVLSLCLVVRSLGGNGASGASVWRDAARPFACWAALLVCVLLLKLTGFFVAFALLTWFVVAVMFRRPHRLAVPIALAGAVAFELVFDWGLGVGLPSGLWH